MKRILMLFATILFCSTVVSSAQQKEYYGLLEASGGYVYKFMPGAETSPQDFMLGVSYVNGYRYGSGCYHYRGLIVGPSVGVKFNCGGKRANVGLAYALDGVLDRTTDAYIRRDYPQFRLKFGVEF